MNKKQNNFAVVLIIILLLPTLETYCFENSLEKSSKVNNYTHRTKFNINNISTWVYNNGDTDIDPNFNTGFIFPKDQNAGLIYESGIIWGGKVNSKVHVGGSTYNQGLLPGRILENGTPQNLDDPSVRIYRVRPGYNSSNLSSEIADEGLTYQELYSNYEKDWNEWPAEWGAPFNDLDNNGIYNPSIDIPGVAGADQTLWYVANDFDTTTCRNFYGSDPLKIEMQVTIWGFKDTFPQKNIMYKKYKLINKSNSEFNEMYISQWADSDVGDASDDYVGCDTLLQMGFGYNSDEYDESYGIYVPAIGFQLMQGPIVEGTPNESAIFNGRIINGYKNLQMTSSLRLLKNSNSPFDDPQLGSYELGTLIVYNFLQGINSDGNISLNPITNEPTKFLVSGDPITNTGWLDGGWYSPGDRRLMISSGPFTISPGDTQEVVLAEIAAIGTSKIHSLELLKSYADINLNSNIKLIQPNLIAPKGSFSKWGPTDEIEFNFSNLDKLLAFNKEDYIFQGINFYLSVLDKKRNVSSIKKTYDIKDGIKLVQSTIEKDGKIFLSNQQNGQDSGIPNSIIINNDPFTNTSLIPGKAYSLGLSAYYIQTFPDTLVFETPIINDEIRFKSESTVIKYADSIFADSYGYDSIRVLVDITNPHQIIGNEYSIKLNDNTEEFSFSLIDNTNNDIIIDNYLLKDFATNNSFEFDEEIGGFNLKIYPENGLFTFDAGRGIEEISFEGYKNNSPREVWFYNSGQYYWIESGLFPPWEVDDLVKKINITRPYDYEIRFNGEDNYGVQFFTTNKIVSVPFELWNIGVDSPDDKTDDIRMIPFIKEYEERNYWGFSDSIIQRVNDRDIIYPYNPQSDQIFWMFSDTAFGGYGGFSKFCSENGIGTVYNPDLDKSPQGYFVDFKDDTTFAIGNQVFGFNKNYISELDSLMPIPLGTIIRFSSTDSWDGKTFTFQTPQIDEPLIDYNFELFQNYPNPFNPNTTIRYFIPEDGNVNIIIFNMLGQKVKTILNKNLRAGKYETEFDGSNLASGVYIYRITKGNFVKSQKMMLLK